MGCACWEVGEKGGPGRGEGASSGGSGRHGESRREREGGIRAGQGLGAPLQGSVCGAGLAGRHSPRTTSPHSSSRRQMGAAIAPLRRD